MKTNSKLQKPSLFALTCSAISFALMAATPALAQASQAETQFADAFAQSQRAASQDVAIPTLDVQRMLVHSAISAINQANLTNDYSVFYKLGSQAFRQVNSEEGLAGQFEAFRQNKIDLNPTLLYQPIWSGSPTIEQGAVRLRGAFDTSPQQVQFDLFFVLEEGRWQVAGISVGLTAGNTVG